MFPSTLARADPVTLIALPAHSQAPLQTEHEVTQLQSWCSLTTDRSPPNSWLGIPEGALSMP